MPSMSCSPACPGSSLMHLVSLVDGPGQFPLHFLPALAEEQPALTVLAVTAQPRHDPDAALQPPVLVTGGQFERRSVVEMERPPFGAAEPGHDSLPASIRLPVILARTEQSAIF